MDSDNQPTVMQPEGSGFRSGFVALTGRPNAGKSTLINQLSGMDLAITSPKPQTTRTAIRAIINRPSGQIILVDTPGLLKPNNRLGTFMAEAIARTVDDADVVLLIVDAEVERTKRGGYVPEQQLLERLQNTGKAVILVLNKVDVMTKEHLLPIIAAWGSRYPFTAIIPVSARTGDGIMVLEAEIMQHLPQGPRYFPEDTVTDQTERVLVAELIREQILRYTHQEIPHGTAVIINAFEEVFADGSATVGGVQKINLGPAGLDDTGLDNAGLDEANEHEGADQPEPDETADDLDGALGGPVEEEDLDDDESLDDDEGLDDEYQEDDEFGAGEAEGEPDAANAARRLSRPDEEPQRTLVRIDATIVCEKDSHKGILIGKGGSMLKTIGMAARLQIEKMTESRVYLELHVKVREDWQNRTGILRDIGYIQER